MRLMCGLMSCAAAYAIFDSVDPAISNMKMFAELACDKYFLKHTSACCVIWLLEQLVVLCEFRTSCFHGAS